MRPLTVAYLLGAASLGVPMDLMQKEPREILLNALLVVLVYIAKRELERIGKDVQVGFAAIDRRLLAYERSQLDAAESRSTDTRWQGVVDTTLSALKHRVHTLEHAGEAAR